MVYCCRPLSWKRRQFAYRQHTPAHTKCVAAFTYPLTHVVKNDLPIDRQTDRQTDYLPSRRAMASCGLPFMHAGRWVYVVRECAKVGERACSEICINVQKQCACAHIHVVVTNTQMCRYTDIPVIVCCEYFVCVLCCAVYCVCMYVCV